MNKHKQRSEETRNRLLAAAESCFAQSGFEATGVARICKTAGVSKGAFYHHFSSKDEIFFELLRRWLDGLDHQLTRLRGHGDDIPQSLMSMMDILTNVLQDAEKQMAIYLEFMNRAIRDPLVLKSLLEPFHRYRKYFAEMIHEGIAQGTFHDVDEETAAWMIISTGIGLLIQGLIDPPIEDWDAHIQHTLSILLNGLIKR